MGAGYHLLLFTDYLTDKDIQYTAGWSIIAVTVLNIIVNMGVMMFFTFKKAIL